MWLRRWDVSSTKKRHVRRIEAEYMTNTIAIALGCLIMAALAVDYVFFDWAYSIALGARFLNFLDYLAFWR